MQGTENTAALLARVVMSLLFIHGGWGKLLAPAATQAITDRNQEIHFLKNMGWWSTRERGQQENSGSTPCTRTDPEQGDRIRPRICRQTIYL